MRQGLHDAFRLLGVRVLQEFARNGGDDLPGRTSTVPLRVGNSPGNLDSFIEVFGIDCARVRISWLSFFVAPGGRSAAPEIDSELFSTSGCAVGFPETAILAPAG